MNSPVAARCWKGKKIFDRKTSENIVSLPSSRSEDRLVACLYFQVFSSEQLQFYFFIFYPVPIQVEVDVVVLVPTTISERSASSIGSLLVLHHQKCGTCERAKPFPKLPESSNTRNFKSSQVKSINGKRNRKTRPS
ncbi:unnamed protein product [Amoebophrya sp. A120]|nr:unnamed protein product [Amoebophrya sp. A120]|eukprot:GSA120T00024057001.1